jgi:hypothetical protein
MGTSAIHTEGLSKRYGNVDALAWAYWVPSSADTS